MKDGGSSVSVEELSLVLSSHEPFASRSIVRRLFAARSHPLQQRAAARNARKRAALWQEVGPTISAVSPLAQEE